VSSIINPIADILAQILRVFFGLTGSYGLAIIVLTVLIKLVLHPLTRKQLRSMKEMQYLAPQVQALREKFRGNPQQMNVEMMNLYRAHNVNPFGGCLPLLFQLPILWGLFRVFLREDIFGDASFLGIPMNKAPHIFPLGSAAAFQNPVLLIFPLLVGVATYFQQRMTVTDPSQARMFVFMPVMVAYFATLYPIGLSIYWIVSTLASIVEFYVVVGRFTPPAPAAPIGPEKPAIAVLPQRPKGARKR
jgi:YidC/Oxa1 family membrane protein insertase